MTLLEKQFAFAECSAKLISWLIARDYGVTYGEAFRPKETAALYASQGRGVRLSNHERRLALDLNLFIAGELLTKTESYEEAGNYWKSLSTSEYQCSWGGDFGDGNHFSIEHGGVR